MGRRGRHAGAADFGKMIAVVSVLLDVMDLHALLGRPWVETVGTFGLMGFMLGGRGRHAGAAALVDHHGADAEDVEHMAERYLDERPGGAVPPCSPSPPRPRCDAAPLDLNPMQDT